MSLNTLLSEKKCLHFIGIGGSGMFPLVQIFHGRGYSIQGSDNNPGDTTALEEKMGMRVMVGHHSENIQGADLIIYSAAIMQDNPELVAAREKGIPIFERAEVLGYITEQFSRCICVSGTHGKTTTTAMLTHILVKAGMDPTAVIGGKLPLIGGNGRAGNSNIMTCEACEFVDTFLQLYPDISIILNIDADHLDYFGTLENIIRSFHKFAQKTTSSIIVYGDDSNSMQAVAGLEKQILTFGFGPGNEYRACNLTRHSPTETSWDLFCGDEKLTTIRLSVPGKHNVLNALAACVAALQIGVTAEQLAQTLPDFTGAGRRFEILGKPHDITIADDYAHHPAELRATLEVAMQMGYNRVWAVFQPFTYSRTSLLLNDFAEALSIADHVVMSEIMGARESNTWNIYTKDLAEKINGSIWFNTFEEIAYHVMLHAKPGDLVITLGCGDIYKCARMMLEL